MTPARRKALLGMECDERCDHHLEVRRRRLWKIDKSEAERKAEREAVEAEQEEKDRLKRLKRLERDEVDRLREQQQRAA